MDERHRKMKHNAGVWAKRARQKGALSSVWVAHSAHSLLSSCICRSLRVWTTSRCLARSQFRTITSNIIGPSIITLTTHTARNVLPSCCTARPDAKRTAIPASHSIVYPFIFFCFNSLSFLQSCLAIIMLLVPDPIIFPRLV